MDSIITYEKFAKYYDAYVQNFTEDIPVYLGLCDTEHKILEIGCGTGRVLKPLLEAGHDVVGVDISREMLDIAEKKLKYYLENERLRLVNHNFTSAPAHRLYDRIITTYYTFNYLTNNSDAKAFLDNVAKSLRRGGVLIIDLFYPKPLSKPGSADVWQKPETFTVDGKKVLLRDKRKMLSGNIEERIQIFEEDEVEEVIITERKFYCKTDICDLLKMAGFENIRVTDGYDSSAFHDVLDNEPTEDSFIVLAEK